MRKPTIVLNLASGAFPSHLHRANGSKTLCGILKSRLGDWDSSAMLISEQAHGIGICRDCFRVFKDAPHVEALGEEVEEVEP